MRPPSADVPLLELVSVPLGGKQIGDAFIVYVVGGGFLLLYDTGCRVSRTARNRPGPIDSR
ncbi:hypothetical protein KIPB_004631, partial [Kipferlia bialata]|eukprot:g4631.t1